MTRFCSTVIMMLTAVALMAAAKVTVTPPPHVSDGEKFAVSVKVEGGNSDSSPEPPQIAGCRYLFGPAVSTSRSTTIINGHVESSSSTVFTFTYRAEKAGSATIPAIKIGVDGKTVATKPVKFTIGERGASASPRNQAVSIDDITTQSSDKPVGANDVFVRIILNRSTAYEQEAIECTIKLYTKYGIEEFFPTKQPSFDGFLIQEVDIKPTLNQREEFGGQVYMTALLKKCIIFPQKSGKLTINSGEYDLSVVQFDQIGMGYFSVASPTRRKLKVNSNSASIVITPLPTPAPEGFSGAVGTFTVDSRLIGNNFRTGEAASLVYTVKGTGNIKYVKEPEIDFPSEFELYTPKSNFEGGVQGANVTGTMTIDYTFVPQSVGEFHIGSDRFVYFDPSERRYVTLTTPAYNIKVAKGASDDRPSEIKAKNTDILHIKRDAAYSAGLSRPVVYTWYYWLLWLTATAVLVTLIGIYRRNLRLNADVAGRRLARADKTASRRLKTARQLMEAGDKDRFYGALLEAVWGYLSDRLSIPASQLSRDNVSDRLVEAGATPELASKFVDVLDVAETARYTPDAVGDRMSRLLASATDAIHAMEKIKTPPRRKLPTDAAARVIILAIASSLFFASPTYGADADVVSRADSAYTAAEYTRAVELYSAAIDSLGPSAALYYNLGNSYYRTGRPGRAIVAYERAMRIDPADRDLRSNLEFVNSRITDRPGERGTLIGQAVRKVALSASANTWGWIAFALFIATLGAIAVYCFSNVIIVRKAGFFGGIMLLIATAVTLYVAFEASSRATAKDIGIIVEPSTILSTSPRRPLSRSEEAMLLHEGTKVKILDSLLVTGDSVPTLWLDVEVDNNHRAWVNSQAVERI